MSLEDAIVQRTARVVQVGLGYMGLFQAAEIAAEGWSVTGLETDTEKVRSVNDGRSYLPDLADSELLSLVESTRLQATSDPEVLTRAEVVCISVSTGVAAGKADFSHLMNVVDALNRFCRPGCLIVLRSTLSPGGTRHLVLPKLQGQVGRDFFLAYVPERGNPGARSLSSARSVLRVVAGESHECCRLVTLLYEQLSPGAVVVASSTIAAELAKLLENMYRFVNISFTNEFSMLAEAYGIDPVDVIELAATKEAGFVPFYPGAGVGGPTVLPNLALIGHAEEQTGKMQTLIQAARAVNSDRSCVIVRRVVAELNGKSATLVDKAKILVLGVSYKPSVPDWRGSSAIPVIRSLLERGMEVKYYDPIVPSLRPAGIPLDSEPLTDQMLSWPDCALILTGHSGFKSLGWPTNSRVVDVCGITRKPNRLAVTQNSSDSSQGRAT